MKNQIDKNKIKELLNSFTTQFTPSTLENLRAARMRAVEQQRVPHKLPILAWLGHENSRHESIYISKRYNMIFASLILAGLISGASIWHSYSTEHEINEVDIAILTDDLPLLALLD